VAAHAEIDDQRPWNSALVFGRPGSTVRLRAGEVAELDLQARLAVLTSCGSAGSTVLSGEGMLGLASGFLSAGIPTVLATLWPVDDREATRFCSRFYEALADGHPAAGALLLTQRWIRSREATAHPFHWAGYVLVGEGAQAVPLVERSPLMRRITGGGLGMAALLVVIVVVRRRRSAPV